MNACRYIRTAHHYYSTYLHSGKQKTHKKVLLSPLINTSLMKEKYKIYCVEKNIKSNKYNSLIIIQTNQKDSLELR